MNITRSLTLPYKWERQTHSLLLQLPMEICFEILFYLPSHAALASTCRQLRFYSCQYININAWGFTNNYNWENALKAVALGTRLILGKEHFEEKTYEALSVVKIKHIDDEKLVTADAQGKIEIWDCSSEMIESKTLGKTEKIVGFATDDEPYLFSYCSDTVTLWNIENFSHLSFSLKEKEISALFLKNNILYFGLNQGRFGQIDLLGNRTLEFFPEPFLSTCEEKSCSMPGVFYQFDHIPKGKHATFGLAVDEMLIASAIAGHNSIYLWDSISRDLILQISHPSSEILSLDIQGYIVAASFRDSSILCWDVRNPQESFISFCSLTVPATFIHLKGCTMMALVGEITLFDLSTSGKKIVTEQPYFLHPVSSLTVANSSYAYLSWNTLKICNF